MICPVCKTAMIVTEYKDIEVDYCCDCAGIWFDSGELSLLFEKLEPGFKIDMANLFKKPSGQIPELPRKCPICRKKMEKVIAADDNHHPIVIDSCAEDGLWFDKGELENITRIIVKAMPQDTGKIISYIQDAFSFEKKDN